MTHALSESAIVRKLAQQVCSRIARRVIKALQQQKNALLSGDDSGLTSAWEELCVQIQGEHSIHWDAYEETVRQWVVIEVEGLLAHEIDAVWLQTTAGENWDTEDEETRDLNPVLAADIVDYVTSEYIYRQAGDWANRRIRQYLER
jgi:hypothetical protein